jgi:hypothetical protein
MLETIGESLDRIKKEDGLTDVDLGRVLGKSDDQAGKYRAGAADMGIVSLLLGCREWDGRFINDALGLFGMKVVTVESSAVTDRETLTALTGLLNEVAIALADDGKIDDRELASMRTELEAAGRAIDTLRERLRLRSVA